MAGINSDSPADGVLDAAAHEFLRTEALSGRGSTRLVSSLVASMRSVGWDGPPINVVVIAGQMYILDGHHRTHAARLADILVRYRTIPIESLPAFGYDSADEVISAHAEAGPNRIRLG